MNKKVIYLTIGLFLILMIGIGLSYAFYVPNIIGIPTTNTTTFSNKGIEVNYVNGSDILIDSNQTSVTKTLVLRNISSVNKKYYLSFDNLTNTFIDQTKLTYSYRCSSSGASCSGYTSIQVPNNSQIITELIDIPVNTTYTYIFTITYNGMPSVGEEFTTNLNTQLFSSIVKRQEWNSTELFWGQSGNITQITFGNTINIPGGVTSWDISDLQDESIMAYIIDDGLGANTCHLHIQSNKIIYANQNSSYLFHGFTKLTQINNLNLLNTNQVTKMRNLFKNCNNLTNLNLSSFNTSLVTDMSSMFAACTSLTTLNFSNATFAQVTTYYNMFQNITSGITIYVKDSPAQTFINARLTDAGKNGIVIIV